MNKRKLTERKHKSLKLRSSICLPSQWRIWTLKFRIRMKRSMFAKACYRVIRHSLKCENRSWRGCGRKWRCWKIKLTLLWNMREIVSGILLWSRSLWRRGILGWKLQIRRLSRLFLRKRFWKRTWLIEKISNQISPKMQTYTSLPSINLM